MNRPKRKEQGKRAGRSAGGSLFSAIGKWPYLPQVLIAVVTFILVFIISATSLVPIRYAYQVGDVADESIRATKDVEDTLTTQKRIDQAVESVDPIYVLSAEVTKGSTEALKSAFLSIRSVRGRAAQDKEEYDEAVRQIEYERQQLIAQQQEDPEAPQVPLPTPLPPYQISQPLLLELKGMIEFQTDNQQILALIALSDDALDRCEDNLNTLFEQALERGIKVEGLAGERLRAYQQLQASMQGALDHPALQVAKTIINGSLEANFLYNQDATEAARRAAADAVTPYVYKKGQVFVRDGDIITEEQIEIIKALGLMQNSEIDTGMYIGMGLFLALLLFLIALYITRYEWPMVTDIRRLILLALLIVVTLALALVFKMIDPRLIPVPLGALLVAVLLHSRLAMVTNVLLAMLVGFMSGEGALTAELFGVTVVYMLGGMTGVYALRRRPDRGSILQAGLSVMLCNAIAYTAIGLLTTSDVRLILTAMFFGLGSGALSMVLCIGLLPLLENLFDLTTPSRLMELANPNHPLLKRLLIEAPGTYHHSIIVANMVENAAEAIGADPLLARVSAYYHDVGKLSRPYFFKENQNNQENPHDRITPELSTMIITSHVGEGMQLAKKHKLPMAVHAAMQQHHGTTPVAYFFHKALHAPGGEDKKIDSFRYPGPRPQTPEIALIMMADTVEAAVRSLKEPTPEKMRALIHKLIRSKLEDGQFDDCPLTLRQIRMAEESFYQVLSGVFHERIEYPSLPDSADGNGLPAART